MKTINDINDALYDTQIPHDMTTDRRIIVYNPNKKSGRFDYVEFEIIETELPNLFSVVNGDTCLLKDKHLDEVVNFVKQHFARVENFKNYLKAHVLKTDTQEKIAAILDGMKDLLLYKNQKYGDSAINPKKIFYKGDSTNSILIRLDDKLGRVMSNPDEKPRINDVADIIGYCTLLLISMGVTPEDLAKFKD